jgi:C4-type Zn-finger protein
MDEQKDIDFQGPPVDSIVICENCKYWENPDGTYGECKQMKKKVSVEVETQVDSSYWLQTFLTDRYFGCILGDSGISCRKET